jgi:hypothetical protein
MTAFHISRIGVTSKFGGDTYTFKAYFQTPDAARTARAMLEDKALQPGPFPARFAEQGECIDCRKLEQAMSWLGLSGPSGEMLSWWVGREVNRLLDAVLEQREAMRDMQPVAYVVYAPNGNVRLWSTEQRQANECAEANGLAVTPLYSHPSGMNSVASVGATEVKPHGQPVDYLSTRASCGVAVNPGASEEGRKQ